MTGLFDLDGKAAVVTGGNRGLGLMIVEGLCEAGVQVIAIGRDEVAGAAVVERMRGRAAFVAGDLGSEDGVRSAAARIKDHGWRPSVLVNNAALVRSAAFANTGPDEWDPVLEVNLKAPFYLTRELAPALAAVATVDDPARVINIGSIEGLLTSGLPVFAYASAKAGLHHLTRALACELGPRNITVNAIAPGTFRTDMSQPGIARRERQLEAQTALGRLGRPDDIAGTVRFLASRAAAYITGAVLPVDGGAGLGAALRRP